MLETAAQNLTFATMELGGKNALLVLEDADLDVAIDVALEGMYYNQGEACTSTARILVADSIHDEFCDRFARATERLVVGDPLHPDTDIGPMVDARQRDRCSSTCGSVSTRGRGWSPRVPSPTTSA